MCGTVSPAPVALQNEHYLFSVRKGPSTILKQPGGSYKATFVFQSVQADSVGTPGWVLPFPSGASLGGLQDKNQMLRLFSNAVRCPEPFYFNTHLRQISIW